METEMKAVGYITPGPINLEHSLLDIDVDKPKIELGHDIIVKVFAVSVTMHDVRTRNGRPPPIGEPFRILGFDASGVVESVGTDVIQFKPGDYVYYAACMNRPGTNSEYHLVDERLVGKKPKNLGHSAAAAIPSAALTSWEMLFTRLRVNSPTPEGSDHILVIGGASGVGSMAIQLLRVMTKLTIITTASRPVSKDWVHDFGAHHVLDERWPLAKQMDALGLGKPGFVFSCSDTEKHVEDIAELIAPQGRFGLCDDPEFLDAVVFKKKSVSIHWEYIFTKSQCQSPNINDISKVLHEITTMVENGTLKSTLSEVAGKIDAETLQKVHKQIESGETVGQICVQGF